MKGFFLVSWIAYNCPGGLFGSMVPVAARKFVCRPEPRLEAYERLAHARARVVALGEASSPRLTLVQGLRLTDRPVVWRNKPKF